MDYVHKQHNIIPLRLFLLFFIPILNNLFDCGILRLIPSNFEKFNMIEHYSCT